MEAVEVLNFLGQLAYFYPASMENSKSSCGHETVLSLQKWFCSRSNAVWCDFSAFENDDTHGI